MRATMARETTWRSAAMLLMLGSILALGAFLLARPLRLESPASGGARAMLRLDHALGATAEPVDAAVAARAGTAGGDGNLVITSIAAGGPAAAAGLRVGDIIQNIGGKPADQLSGTDFSGPLLVSRGGRSMTVRVRFSAPVSGRGA